VGACVRVELVSLCKLQSKSDYRNQSGSKKPALHDPEFVNVKEAQESIPRNRRQPV
jgi:hypothetical protein